MPRVIKGIEIEGQPATALFDTNALYSFVSSRFVRCVTTSAMVPPVRVSLGDRRIEIQTYCLVQGTIEGLSFFTDAAVVDDLGRADGQVLDAIIGARSMAQWEIRVDPRNGSLDLEGLRRREFTEFIQVTARP